MLVCLSVIMTMAFVAVPAQAAVVDNTVEPCWDNTAIINLTLGFDDGIGGADAFVAGYPGTTKIEASVYVYRKSGLLWKYVTEEHVTINAMTGVLSCSFSATQGTYYKAEYTFIVTRNGTNESISKTQYRTYE